jgi:hypothetical protein
MFHLCPTYVASNCFMLQVFYGGTVSDGRMARAPGDMVRDKARDRPMGAYRARADSGVPPTWRERKEGVRGKEQGAARARVRV